MKKKAVYAKKKPGQRAKAAKIVKTGGPLRQRARMVVKNGRGK